MMSHEINAIVLTSKRVFRRPILSDRYPDNRLPMGQVIDVIEANQEISDALKVNAASACDKNWLVIAG